MRQFKVERTSMYPTLNKGDKIVIAKDKQYEVGDILIYKKKNFLISHRLIKIKVNYFILKGDNNIHYENINTTNIMGKIIFINTKKFNNNTIQKIIAFFSFIQSKLCFLFYENNSFLRKIFKVITNPVLYIHYLFLLK